MAKSRLVLKEQKGASSSLARDIRVDRPVELKIGYIGGGSRGWAPALMQDLARCPWFCGEVRLYDLDHDAARFNAEYGNWIQQRPDALSSWTYRAVPTMKESLRGSDFVFLSIQPGPVEFIQHDLEIPARYGVYQPVGDSVGPGGIIRGFRSVRIYEKFAAAIAEHCPKAWVLNFTNPMTVCTRTLFAVFPQIKAMGLCHEVFGTQHLLASLMSRYLHLPKPPRHSVRVNVLGINHFTWIDRAECEGEDLLQIVRRHTADPRNMRLYTRQQVLAQCPTVFASMHRVAFELMKRFGVLGAAGDRHLAEFVPWFLTGPTSCYKWGFRMTPYSFRINRWNKARQKFIDQMAGHVPFQFDDTGEEYINQMAALVGLTEFRTNINLPNRGQMDGVPHGAVVETNAVFTKNSIDPVASGRLSDPINALVYVQVINQESVVKAALTGDKDLGFRAFINDPLNHRLSLDSAWKMYNEMLKATEFRF